MSRLKITKGENFTVESSNFEDLEHNRYGIIANLHNGWGRELANVKSAWTIDGTIEEAKSNAELIADAFNTANETDKLPSEIKQERDDLIRVLQDFISSGELIDDEYFSMEIDQANKLINEIENNE